MNSLDGIIERYFSYIFEEGHLKISFTYNKSMKNFLVVYREIKVDVDTKSFLSNYQTESNTQVIK